MDEDMQRLVSMKSQLDLLIEETGEVRDRYRQKEKIGRNLSLAITHLEDAQDRLKRALDGLAFESV